eukprot:TRINITY_DN5921_c0_g1_i11.p1 TRINITY_DN5921_c0_g1~~TRINITY_DN5921_c0_g1_i11.p1  ORF type:complete len:1060 (-),score=127.15 TRINITY_DN5921_c0_g1_i11:427-3606(-)
MSSSSNRGGNQNSMGHSDRGRGQSRGQSQGGGRTGGHQYGNNYNRGGGGGRASNSRDLYNNNNNSAHQQNGNGYNRGGRNTSNGYVGERSQGGQDSSRRFPASGRDNTPRGRGTEGPRVPYNGNRQQSTYSGNQQNGGNRNYQNNYGNSNMQYSRGGRSDGGYGRGSGGQGDVVLSDQEAQIIMQQFTRAVNSVRPEAFCQKPKHERVSGNGFALRPNRVNPKIWKQVVVEQNLFEVESLAEYAYQYSLQVTLKKGGQFVLDKKILRQVFDTLSKENQWSHSTIYNGRNTLWDQKGDLRKLEYYPIKIDARKDEVYVVLKFATQFDMRALQKNTLEKNVRDLGWVVPPECLRVLDCALRHGALGNEAYSVQGSQIYDLNQKGEQLDGNRAMELLTGYRQSVKVVTEGLVVNVNTIYKMARKPSHMMSFLKDHNIQDFNTKIYGRTLETLSCVLEGVKVKTAVKGSKETRKLQQRIKCISNQTAVTAKFQLDGRLVSVEQYYLESYGYRLKYPHLNVLDCSKSPEKQVMVPMEICTIKEGQFEMAEGRLQAELIRKAAKLPSIRHEDIQTALTDVDKRINESPAQYWINIRQRNWLRGGGFQIPSPVIQFNGGRNVRPQNGEWKGFQKGKDGMDFHPYYDAKPIRSWAVIDFCGDGQIVEQFCTDVVNFGQKVGMKVANFSHNIVVQGRGPNNLTQKGALRYIEMAEEKAKLQYKCPPEIFIILFEKKSKQGYELIKTLLEGNSVNCFKLVSSVALMQKYRKGAANFNYLKNWMLKVNIKLGGTNFRLHGGYKFLPRVGSDKSFYPIMFMGVDVAHPTGTNKNEGASSIASVTASMDDNFARYDAGEIVSQKGKQERIHVMELCTGNILQQFLDTRGQLPQTIIMYRDGIDWGQCEQIMETEFRGMKAATKAFDTREKPYNPKITFVIATKRHSHRPRPVDKEGDDGKGRGNMAPGIVIDCSGLHHCEFQFELQSHMTIQGTGRPVIYTVLVDEVGFGAEQLQMLTHWLTHTYQRCYKSVSIAPPAFLAHHMCKRGRIFENQGCSGSLVHPQMKSKMYWI